MNSLLRSIVYKILLATFIFSGNHIFCPPPLAGGATEEDTAIWHHLDGVEKVLTANPTLITASAEAVAQTRHGRNATPVEITAAFETYAGHLEKIRTAEDKLQMLIRTDPEHATQYRKAAFDLAQFKRITSTEITSSEPGDVAAIAPHSMAAVTQAIIYADAVNARTFSHTGIGTLRTNAIKTFDDEIKTRAKARLTAPAVPGAPAHFQTFNVLENPGALEVSDARRAQTAAQTVVAAETENVKNAGTLAQRAAAEARLETAKEQLEAQKVVVANAQEREKNTLAQLKALEQKVIVTAGALTKAAAAANTLRAHGTATGLVAGADIDVQNERDAIETVDRRTGVRTGTLPTRERELAAVQAAAEAAYAADPTSIETKRLAAAATLAQKEVDDLTAKKTAFDEAYVGAGAPGVPGNAHLDAITQGINAEILRQKDILEAGQPTHSAAALATAKTDLERAQKQLAAVSAVAEFRAKTAFEAAQAATLNTAAAQAQREADAIRFTPLDPDPVVDAKLRGKGGAFEFLSAQKQSNAETKALLDAVQVHARVGGFNPEATWNVSIAANDAIIAAAATKPPTRTLAEASMARAENTALNYLKAHKAEKPDILLRVQKLTTDAAAAKVAPTVDAAMRAKWYSSPKTAALYDQQIRAIQLVIATDGRGQSTAQEAAIAAARRMSGKDARYRAGTGGLRSTQAFIENADVHEAFRKASKAVLQKALLDQEKAIQTAARTIAGAKTKTDADKIALKKAYYELNNATAERGRITKALASDPTTYLMENLNKPGSNFKQQLEAKFRALPVTPAIAGPRATRVARGAPHPFVQGPAEPLEHYMARLTGEPAPAAPPHAPWLNAIGVATRIPTQEEKDEFVAKQKRYFATTASMLQRVVGHMKETDPAAYQAALDTQRTAIETKYKLEVERGVGATTAIPAALNDDEQKKLVTNLKSARGLVAATMTGDAKAQYEKKTEELVASLKKSVATPAKLAVSAERTDLMNRLARGKSEESAEVATVKAQLVADPALGQAKAIEMARARLADESAQKRLEAASGDVQVKRSRDIPAEKTKGKKIYIILNKATGEPVIFTDDRRDTMCLDDDKIKLNKDEVRATLTVDLAAFKQGGKAFDEEVERAWHGANLVNSDGSTYAPAGLIDPLDRTELAKKSSKHNEETVHTINGKGTTVVREVEVSFTSQIRDHAFKTYVELLREHVKPIAKADREEQAGLAAKNSVSRAVREPLDVIKKKYDDRLVAAGADVKKRAAAADSYNEDLSGLLRAQVSKVAAPAGDRSAYQDVEHAAGLALVILDRQRELRREDALAKVRKALPATATAQELNDAVAEKYAKIAEEDKKTRTSLYGKLALHKNYEQKQKKQKLAEDTAFSDLEPEADRSRGGRIFLEQEDYNRRIAEHKRAYDEEVRKIRTHPLFGYTGVTTVPGSATDLSTLPFDELERRAFKAKATLAAAVADPANAPGSPAISNATVAARIFEAAHAHAEGKIKEKFDELDYETKQAMARRDAAITAHKAAMVVKLKEEAVNTVDTLKQEQEKLAARVARVRKGNDTASETRLRQIDIELAAAEKILREPNPSPLEKRKADAAARKAALAAIEVADPSTLSDAARAEQLRMHTQKVVKEAIDALPKTLTDAERAVRVKRIQDTIGKERVFKPLPLTPQQLAATRGEFATRLHTAEVTATAGVGPDTATKREANRTAIATDLATIAMKAEAKAGKLRPTTAEETTQAGLVKKTAATAAAAKPQTAAQTKFAAKRVLTPEQKAANILVEELRKGLTTHAILTSDAVKAHLKAIALAKAAAGDKEYEAVRNWKTLGFTKKLSDESQRKLDAVHAQIMGSIKVDPHGAAHEVSGSAHDILRNLRFQQKQPKPAAAKSGRRPSVAPRAISVR